MKIFNVIFRVLIGLYLSGCLHVFLRVNARYHFITFEGDSFGERPRKKKKISCLQLAYARALQSISSTRLNLYVGLQRKRCMTFRIRNPYSWYWRCSVSILAFSCFEENKYVLEIETIASQRKRDKQPPRTIL